MPSTKKNKAIFPKNTYTGANISYFNIEGDQSSSLQIDHPAAGSFQILVSNDFDNQAYVDKSWTVLPVKLLGTTTYIAQINFIDTEPTIIKINTAAYAFMQCVLTGAGGTYRANYNVPITEVSRT